MERDFQSGSLLQCTLPPGLSLAEARRQEFNPGPLDEWEGLSCLSHPVLHPKVHI